MYGLNPPAVFAHQRVLDNRRALERMKRLCAGLGLKESDVPIVTYDDLDSIIEAAGATEDRAPEDVIKGGHGRVRLGYERLTDDPVIVFNTFTWGDAKPTEPLPRRFRHPRAQSLSHLLWGAAEEFAFSRREVHHGHRPEGYICQGGWGLHSVSGCVHQCDYCHLGNVVVMQLDLEDLGDVCERTFQERPHQCLYRYDLCSDIPCFEPEYGGYEVLGERFAKWDKYLLVYTKSANVDFLLDLPHKRHVPYYITLAMDSVTRGIERNTPSLDERIEAMRKCQEAGYTVRAGFTPIIPVADWRGETTEALERLYSRVEPDVIRLWVLSMMEAREFGEIFDLDEMDPWAVRRMWEDGERMTGTHKSPFPSDVRAGIYAHYIRESRRISPETPVALCTEDPDVWDILECELQMTRDQMFCCCGGQSAPRV